MANGTIAFDTLSTSGQISGTAKSLDTDYLASGSAKVWAQATGDGTSFNGSFNTSSLTDTGTGVIITNYNNNMSNDDASLTIGHQFTSAAGTGAYFANAGTRATSSHRQEHFQNGSNADSSMYNSTVHGDLA